MVIQKNNLYRVIIAAFLILFGVLGRIFLRDLLPTIPHWQITINGITQPLFMMDMFFIVGAIALLSGLLLGGYYTLIVPLGIIFLSDLYYGNTYIFLFTWSGFVLIGLLGYTAKKRVPLTPRSLFPVTGLGIAGVLLYDFWTNFGCWLMWYPPTLNGLIRCYILAVPFTLWHLTSTLLILPVLWLATTYLRTTKLHMQDIVITPLEKYVTMSAASLLIIASLLFIF